MVALIVNLLHWLSAALLRHAPTEQVVHHMKLPLPPIIHKVLDAEAVDRFDEVLIIGDIHGCYDEMLNLLRQAEQEVKGGRLLKLFVGDLVNKGPKNVDVVRYFLNEGREDSLSVRGNNDEYIISEYLKYRDDPASLSPNRHWIKNFTDEEIDYLISLPYTISLPSLNSIIVHAGLIPGVPLEKNKLYDMVNMRNVIYGDYFDDGGIQGTKSDTQGDPWASSWKGPQMVYFGHDAKRELQRNPFSLGLDTGCVYGRQLTGVFIKQQVGKLIQVAAQKAYEPIREKNEL